MIRLLHVVTVQDALLFLAGQVAYMREHGFEISIISSPGERLEAFGRDEGVDVYGVDMPRRITPLRDLASLGRLARLVSRIRPDIVHANTPKGGLLGTLAAALARVPVRIYQMRGLPMMTATGGARVLLATTERVSCAFATQVICNSRSLMDSALHERLCPAEKLHVLLGGSGNGVDSRRRFNRHLLPPDTRVRVRRELGISDTDLVIGFVGRLVKDKGVRELLAAWSDLKTRVPTSHLVVIGPFEERDGIGAVERRLLEADPHVHLLGFRSDTPDLYAAMDVVLLPTYREGFPNVLLEAAAMELPVVATRVAGCVDAVVDGVTGTLVPAADSNRLRDATLAYLADPALRRRHGAAARQRVVDEFDQERLWAALESLYRAELGERAPGSERDAFLTDTR
jgi:glycosyltransferase involved in cell wall biosynthesis